MIDMFFRELAGDWWRSQSWLVIGGLEVRYMLNHLEETSQRVYHVNTFIIVKYPQVIAV